MIPTDVAVAPADLSAETPAAPRWYRRRPELLVGAAFFLVMLALSGRYAWFNDELYFIVAGGHPAWGYPDQPAFNPLAVRALYDLGGVLGGGRLELVRGAAGLLVAGSVVFAGMTAGVLGGGPAARATAAGLWAVSDAALVNGHLFVTGTLDVLSAAVLCWCLAHAVRSGRPFWLAWAGLALAAGLTNKLLVGIMAAALLVTLLTIGPRRLLRSWWAVLGGALAVLAAAPYLSWQAVHGFPQASVSRSIATLAETELPGQLFGQATMLAIPALPFFVAGMVHLFRSERLRPYRFLGLGYLLTLAVVLLTEGRGYYTSGFGPVLAAFGGLAAEQWLRRGSRVARRAVLAGVLALSFVVGALFCLPVIPADRLQASRVGVLNPILIDEIGWPELVRTVAAVRDELPERDRDQVVIFAGSFAHAGAIDVYGRELGLGLPPAYSGHNGYAEWGPPTGTGPVILVGFTSPADVADAFRDCRLAALTDNGVGLKNSTHQLPILRCAGTTRPWAQLWPRLVHYDLGLSRTLPPR